MIYRILAKFWATEFWAWIRSDLQQPDLSVREDDDPEPSPPTTDMKLCRVCGPERGLLPLSAFWRSAKSADGYRDICKSCANKLWPRNRNSGKNRRVQGAELQLVFALRDKGLSYQEIAKQIGRPRQTISGIIYRANPTIQQKPRAHPKAAVPKPDDDHPSKKLRGQIKPGDPLWPVEEAILRDRRAQKLEDERRKRLRAEWSR